ncbi:MAG: hypothetical protein M3040_03155 [Bacteroidota bacterium]|nr:hypothetical protein [Bacteroidota bacterium]
MDFAKAYSLYKNDKTLQILRAENFPLIISFLHLALYAKVIERKLSDDMMLLKQKLSKKVMNNDDAGN